MRIRIQISFTTFPPGSGYVYKEIFLAAQFFIQKIRYLVENISRRDFMFPFTLAGNKNGSDRRSPALPAVRDYDPPVSVRRFQSAGFSPE